VFEGTYLFHAMPNVSPTRAIRADLRLA